MTPNEREDCEQHVVMAVATPVYDDSTADIPPVVASPDSPEQLAMRQRNQCVGHLLRTIGWLCILLSVAEVGVGGAIYSFFDNVHFGTSPHAKICMQIRMKSTRFRTMACILRESWGSYSIVRLIYQLQAFSRSIDLHSSPIMFIVCCCPSIPLSLSSNYS